MRMSGSIIIAGALLFPLQAVAQSGSVGSSGGGAAGVTTGTAAGSTGSTTGAPNLRMPPAPGVNSAGTAQSSGSMTTGSAGGSTGADEKIRAEDPKIDKKLKSICRGC